MTVSTVHTPATNQPPACCPVPAAPCLLPRACCRVPAGAAHADKERVAEFAASGLLFKDTVEVTALEDPESEWPRPWCQGGAGGRRRGLC